MRKIGEVVIKYAILAVIGVILMIGVFSLGSTPPPTDFEAWMVEPGWVLLREGKMYSGIFDNMLETRNGCVGQGNALHFLFGLASAAFGTGIDSSRAVSFIVGVVLLWTVYRLTSDLVNRLAAFYAVLTLVSTTAFFYATHLARASIFLGALNLIAIFCLFRSRKADGRAGGLYALGASLAAFGALMFHWGGVLVALSVTVLFLIEKRKSLLSRGVFMYFSGMAAVAIVWILVHVAPLGLSVFLEKFQAGHGPLLGGVKTALAVAWRYFFVSRLNIFYLVAFLSAAFLIVKMNDETRLLLVYLAIYAALSAFLVEDPEPHKAIVFIPVFSVCIGTALVKAGAVISGSGSRRAGVAVKISFTILVLCAFFSVTAGAAKHVLYIIRSRSVNYERYMNDIKEAVPAKARVLGQPHLWFALASRNTLLGGTYYIGRACSGKNGLPRWRVDRSGTALSASETEDVLNFLRKKNIEYIVASEDLYDAMQLNGFFKNEHRKRIKEVKKIPSAFYGRERFEPGIVRIYKIE